MTKIEKDLLDSETEKSKILKEAFMKDEIEASDFIKELLSSFHFDKKDPLEAFKATEIIFSHCIFKKLDIENRTYELGNNILKVHSLQKKFFWEEMGVQEKQEMQDNLLKLYVDSGWDPKEAFKQASWMILKWNLQKQGEKIQIESDKKSRRRSR